MKSRSINITGTTPIPTNALPTILPAQIVFRELYLINNDTEIRYSRIDKRIPWKKLKHNNINDVIKNIDKYIKKSIEQDVSEKKLEDIPIRKPSYLILRIKDTEPHDFSRITGAVTLLDESFIDYFENLVHVDVNGQLSTTPPSTKCRLVVLSVRPLPKKGDSQAIALNFNNDRGQLISIDPDIRYPGNGGAIDGNEPDPIVLPPQPATGKKHRGQ
jgi:hypothetical protein